MTVTIPGKFLGGDESDREVPTSGLALEIPGFEKPVVLLQSPEGGGLEPGVVIRMTGTLFSGEELVGVAVGWRDVVFLLPEARPPPK